MALDIQEYAYHPSRPLDIAMKVINKQDCDCDEGCYYCMITLRLKVTNREGIPGSFMHVTSNMLDVTPSPGGVSLGFWALTLCLIRQERKTDSCSPPRRTPTV